VGEKLALFRPTFNRSIRIEARPKRLTTDLGAVLLREIMEQLGIVCRWDGGEMAPKRRDTRDSQGRGKETAGVDMARAFRDALIKPLREPFLDLQVSGQGVRSLPPVPKGVLFPHFVIHPTQA